MAKQRVQFSLQDSLCLRFLWKWKLLSTSALKTAIYKDKTLECAYKRLKRLENAKLIRAICAESGGSYLWQLDDLGFKVIEPSMPQLKDKGYKSENKEHDFWVTAVHLGDWLSQIPNKCDIFSEQQLRRNELDAYPDWVPKTEDHRPDGWWKVFDSHTGKTKLVALEVELTRKTNLAYENVGEFYSTHVTPYQVVWVVRRKSFINYIQRSILVGSKSGGIEQSYLTLDQFIQSQWQAPILSGKNEGRKLAEILGTSTGQSIPFRESPVLLDTRKKPMKSKTPSKSQFLEEGVSHTYMF